MRRARRRTRVGLVLGGGGLAGMAYHAGVLAALEEATGWDPRAADLLVGTSAGSGTAALLRAGVTGAAFKQFIIGNGRVEPGTLLAEFQGTWEALRALPPLSLRSFAVSPSGSVPYLLGAATRGRKGLTALAANAIRTGGIDLDPYVAALADHYGGRWPESPLCTVAVRRSDGHRVLLDNSLEGRCDVGTAVAASSCIPGYFRPVVIEDEAYVDGGIHSPTNADVLCGQGLDLVIVSAPMSTRKSNWTVSVDQAVRRFARALLDTEADELRDEGTEVVCFNPGTAEQRAMGLNLMDAERAANVAVIAKTAALHRLTSTKRTHLTELLRALPV